MIINIILRTVVIGALIGRYVCQDAVITQFLNVLTVHGDKISNLEKLFQNFTTMFEDLHTEVTTLKIENSGLKEHITVHLFSQC